MSKRGPVILLVVAAALFVAGVGGLLRLRFSRGDVFPAYSTYRADPLGTRALYESLEIVDGVRVQRWLRETEKLPAPLRGTLVFAGMDRDQWEAMPAAGAERLDALVRGGTRLVVAFSAGFEERELRRWRQSQHDTDDDPGVYDFLARPAQMDAYKSKKTPPKNAQKEKTADESKSKTKTKFVDMGEKWGVKPGLARVYPDKNGRLPDALRAVNQADGWPEKLDWLSELYFEAEKDAGWNTLYTREKRAVLIGRKLGAGSIVLASDSFFLSNEALQRARATPLLAWLAGAEGGGLVMFDEHHLGMEMETGVAALARRHGLGGAACMLALFAGLWIWRRMALFTPPPADGLYLETGYEPTAGLEALLRRSVPRGQLAGVCLAEWKKSAKPADAARVDRAIAGLEQDASPEKVYEAAREALRKR